MKFTVFYQMPEQFSKIMRSVVDQYHITEKDVQDESKYKMVFVIDQKDHPDIEDLEDVYHYMQAENWSRNGEARGLIHDLGLAHTSISVGDVVQKDDGSLWVVCMRGFSQIKN
jgi:hypothetical protein